MTALRTDFVLQTELAARLCALYWAALDLTADPVRIGALQNEARRTGRDFYRLVAARALGVDFFEVLTEERTAVKHALFMWMYTIRPGDRITRFQDSVIISRS